MPIIELPEFGSAQVNENAPTVALRKSGWADGDQPPASVMNWITRANYDTVRALLGLNLATLADNFGLGPELNVGTDYQIQAFGHDANGYVIAVQCDNVGGGIDIYLSTDNGETFSSVYTLGGTFLTFDAVAVSDGAYAVAASQVGVGGYWYAAFPYTSWNVVAHSWGGQIVDYMTADIGDGHGPSLLLLTDAGSIWVADATSTPTVSGDWTEYDISSVMDTPTSFALDPATGTLVVAGSHAAAGRTIYCDVADGVAAGDFTVTAQSSTTVAAIAYNGERFVIVIAPSEDMRYSDDGITWTTTLNGPAVISSTYQTILADQATGFFYLLDGEPGSAACQVAASREGIFWTRVTTGAQNLYIDGKRGPAPKLHPITHRFHGITYDAGGVGTQHYFMQTL